MGDSLGWSRTAGRGVNAPATNQKSDRRHPFGETGANGSTGHEQIAVTNPA